MRIASRVSPQERKRHAWFEGFNQKVNSGKYDAFPHNKTIISLAEGFLPPHLDDPHSI